MIQGLLRLLLRKKKKQATPKPQSLSSPEAQPLSKAMAKNVQYIQQLMDNPYDLQVREFKPGDHGHPCAVVCIDSLVSKDEINNQIMKTAMLGAPQANIKWPKSGNEIVNLLRDQIISDYDIRTSISMDEIVLSILDGNAVIFVDGADQVLITNAKGFTGRPIMEPETEAVIRGPRDGFTENLQIGTGLLRSRVRDPNLRLHSMRIGRRAKKGIIVAFMAGIAHPELVAETKRRLESIDMDDAEGSGFIEQWISDSFLTPFPLVTGTERPDKIAAAILQGKIGILVDGTPFALVLPLTIGDAFKSPEDYYFYWLSSSLIRFLRYGSAFVAAFLPGLYIALLEYHHGMVPSKLIFSIAGSREGVPFPAVVEAVVMELTLEVLREAGVRLPKPIGQTIGIVGGLVIGEAAVAAGIVSPIMVIVVSLTAIASFSLPSYGFAMSLRMIRFFIMIAASFMGLYSLVLAYIVINIHVVNLKSFGIPYSTPYAPTFIEDFKDLILRAPATMFKQRLKTIQPVDETRQKNAASHRKGK